METIRINGYVRGERRGERSKLQNNCTGTIRSEIFDNETVEVEVCNTHYGHIMDI